jgi:hypothetical protein
VPGLASIVDGSQAPHLSEAPHRRLEQPDRRLVCWLLAAARMPQPALSTRRIGNHRSPWVSGQSSHTEHAALTPVVYHSPAP